MNHDLHRFCPRRRIALKPHDTSTNTVLAPGLVCDAAVWQQQVHDLGSYRMRRPVVTVVVDYDLCDDLGAMADRLLARCAREIRAGRPFDGRPGRAGGLCPRAPERVTHLALLDTGKR